MGLVKLEKDSLTKPVIVVVPFPARNFSPAEMNQCQEEGVASFCSFFSSFSFFPPPPSCNLQFAFLLYPKLSGRILIWIRFCCCVYGWVTC